MPGAIWAAVIPYVASSCGVATYTVPVKSLWACAPTWCSVAAADSSRTADRACRLAARLPMCLLTFAIWVLLSGVALAGALRG